MKLFLVRHGETDWNKELRYQGRRDISLNANGMEQARTAGEKLRPYTPSAIYSSSLTRAMQTSEIIGGILGLVPHSEPRLQEIHFGEWEGKTYPEVVKLYPQVVKIWQEDPLTTGVPGGERLQEVLDRTLEVLREIYLSNEGDVVIVTHGGPIRLLLYHIGAEGAMWEYPVKPGSVTLLEQDGDTLKLVKQL